MLRSGFAITGTWPVGTELGNRMNGLASNALASSIVLVCRPRATDAAITDRKGFLAALKASLPQAVRELQEGNVAPVDLAQAAIGPGMAVFSRYPKVVESDGAPMRVRTALGLIYRSILRHCYSHPMTSVTRQTLLVWIVGPEVLAAIFAEEPGRTATG